MHLSRQLIQPIQLGKAIWSDQGSQWLFDARGGKHGIGISVVGTDRRLLSFSSVDQPKLPEAAEQ